MKAKNGHSDNTENIYFEPSCSLRPFIKHSNLLPTHDKTRTTGKIPFFWKVLHYCRRKCIYHPWSNVPMDFVDDATAEIFLYQDLDYSLLDNGTCSFRAFEELLMNDPDRMRIDTNGLKYDRYVSCAIICDRLQDIKISLPNYHLILLFAKLCAVKLAILQTSSFNKKLSILIYFLKSTKISIKSTRSKTIFYCKRNYIIHFFLLYKLSSCGYWIIRACQTDYKSSTCTKHITNINRYKNLLQVPSTRRKENKLGKCLIYIIITLRMWNHLKNTGQRRFELLAKKKSHCVD